jgi:hypothetical protein
MTLNNPSMAVRPYMGKNFFDFTFTENKQHLVNFKLGVAIFAKFVFILIEFIIYL